MSEQWYKHIIRRRWILIVSIALLVLVTLLLYSQRPLTVQVAYPERDVPVTVFGLGTVEARVISEVGFEVGATLIELHVDHGDHVSKDAVLARLHSGEQQAQLAKARAGVANAEASFNMTQAMVEQARAVLAQRKQTNLRQQRLLAKNTVSAEVAEDTQLQQDVATAALAVALSEVEVAKAGLAGAKAQLQYDNVLLDHHVLRSPYEAIVVKRHHELGRVLSAGASLFTLVDTSTVWALAYVDESRAGDIRVDQPAEVRLRSLPQAVFKGQVARIDIESDRLSEERRVYVACEECPANFHLGEQAEVFITTMRLNDVTLIPEESIIDSKESSGDIWVVSDHHLHRRTVQFGARTLEGRREIASELNGDLPVIGLHKKLREGGLVNVTEVQTQ